LQTVTSIMEHLITVYLYLNYANLGGSFFSIVIVKEHVDHRRAFLYGRMGESRQRRWIRVCRYVHHKLVLSLLHLSNSRYRVLSTNRGAIYGTAEYSQHSI
jgi:hypothetical protein